ncbi:MAG: ZPR1 zinc finger domain-containing protein [Candidatus Altiarchaeota archaeon]|nr:ZPR1 zinc finger domain-containing protein [Candidatus Altiarchaeota archaeon]
MICPVCEGHLKVAVKEQQDFIGGNMTLISMSCSSCSYKSFDVVPTESRPPIKLVLHVKEKKDLNILIARSSSATIQIPEIGASIEPGTASPGFITTVEGILMKFKKYVKSPDAIKLVNHLLAGEPFTLIVEDPRGNSAVNSLKVEVKGL